MKARLFLAIIAFLLFLPNADAAPIETRNTILLIDVSGSMQGDEIRKIQAKLNAELDTQPDKNSLLLYTFAEDLKSIDIEGRSKQQIVEQITANKEKSHTCLYDSILELLPTAHSLKYTITIISDGDDSQSANSISELLESINTFQVPVTFVEEFVDPRFLSVTERISTAYLNPQNVQTAFSTNSNTVSTLALAIAICTSVFIFLALSNLRLIVLARKKRAAIQELIASESYRRNSKLGSQSAANFSFNRILNKWKTPLYLQSSSSKLLATFALITSFIFLVRLFNNLLVAFLASFAVLVFAIQWQNRRAEITQRRAFEKELPAALKMLASSLTAGMSFLQALSAFAEDDHGPCAQEFKRALIEIQYGAPIERALDAVANRMASEDLRWAVSAFTLQREVGGSLAAILNSTAQTIESRFELRREVRTLSAEGRLSSYILMALPVGIFAFLSFLRPQYVAVFITEPIGNLLLAIIVIALSLAWIWLKSLVRISL
jgi:tight adherence protein B